MPRFTKLSQAVYEKLGDEVTNQLIDWMNLMDASWKEELRARGGPSLILWELMLDQRFRELRGFLAKELELLEIRLETKLIRSGLVAQ